MATTELIWGPEVLVPVPLKMAEQVVKFMEQVKAGRVTSHMDDSTAEAVVVRKQGPWDEDMVRRLAQEVRYEGVLALLDRCANTPGEWVNKAEVEEAISMDPLTLRNQLGALSKAAKRLFGRVTWPVEWTKEPDGRYIYKMDSTVARWWNAARQRSI